MDQIIGLIKNGKFLTVDKTAAVKLFTIAQVEGRPPTELDVAKYEGKAVMVTGDLSGDILYQAEVIDEAGPILTSVVLEIFGKYSK